MHTLVRIPGRVTAVLLLALGLVQCNTSTSSINAGSIVGEEALKGRPGILKVLRRDGFVVTRETATNIFNFYDPLNMVPEDARKALLSKPNIAPEPFIQKVCQLAIRPLITTDTLLHAYSVIYSDAIRSLEKQQSSVLRKWQEGLWERFAHIKNGTKVLSKAELADLVGLIAVGRGLMEPKWKPDDIIREPAWINEELKRIRAGKGRSYSEAWRRQIEYSSFRPRGIYAGDAELERYFLARIWWSRFPFRLQNDRELRIVSELATVDRGLYQPLIDPYRKLLGDREDPDLLDLAKALLHPGDGDMFVTHPKRALSIAVKHLEERFYPAIRIGDSPGKLSQSSSLFGIYVMPPCYVLSSDVFTITTRPPILNERMPSGLDLMAVLGSGLAQQLLMAGTELRFRVPLKAAIQTVKIGLEDKQRKVSEVTSLHHGVLQAILNPLIGPNHPRFMKTEGYRKKSLQTALASWAEHRNRWVLHAKQSSSLFGDISIHLPPGFVEPNIEFWQRLLDLTVITRNRLCEYEVGDDIRWNKLTEMLIRCRRIAEKQLVNKPLSAKDRKFFDSFGKRLATLCGVSDPGLQWRRPQSVVADVHREVLHRKVLHVGTGLPVAMYAVFRYRGRDWLCKGGVMTYREYIANDGRTIDDAVWSQMLITLPPPEWMK